MPKINKEQLENLARLQEVENESAKVKVELSQVNERVKNLDLRLESHKKVIEEEQSKLDELKLHYRALEVSVQANTDKVIKSKEKLRSVKTNKEYQSSLKEIEDLDAMNSQIEDQMLACLDQIEAAEKSVTAEESEYSRLCGEIEEEKKKVGAETEAGRATLESLDKDRLRISAKLDPELLDKFNIIKGQQPTGVAVALAKDSICLGCNMNIPPQMYNELQRLDSLKLCPYCERILYWKES